MLFVTLMITAAQIVAPPMVRTWTLATGGGTSILGSRNGVCYYATNNHVGAVRESDGKLQWEKSFSSISAPSLGPSFIAFSHGEEKKAFLVVLDAKSGTKLASRAVPRAESLAVDGSTIYAVSGGTLRLFNPNLAPLRSLNLAAKASDMRGQLVIAGDFAAVALYGDKWVVLHKRTLKKLWELKDQYAGLYPMVLSNGLLLVRGDKDGVFDARTGRKAWSLNDTDWAVVSGNTCLLQEKADYVGRDWRTGRELWRLPGAPEYSGGNDSGSVSADGQTFFAGGDRLVAISVQGQKLWMANHTRPDIALSNRWIISDGDRLLGYAPGKKIQIPTDAAKRQKLAQRLVREFELLDDHERDLLIPLAREGVKPLLVRYVQLAQEYEALDRGRDVRDRSQDLYGLLDRGFARRLDQMLTKADTPVLLDTIRQVEAEWWRDRVLVPLLMRHGDAEQATPFFLDQIKKQKDPEQETSSLEAISKSRHPEAVKFLIEALTNEDAPSPWRRQAFIRLAGTGGEAGVEAVRTARPKPGPLSRWQSRVDMGSRRTKLKEGKDSNGHNWVLFQSGVLGNYSDYYMAERTSAGFGEPIFLGFFDRDVWEKKAATEHRGVPMATLTAKEWIKLFPSDPEVRKDSDGDGLTDLVEARLGTNPSAPDSDSDGHKDDIDPCPNAGPRELGDREKIVEAAVTAHFFENDWGVPAVISVDGVKPFEFAGYPAPVVWTENWREGSLGAMYGGGVNLISFTPARDFDEKIAADTDWLEIAPDGKSARTLIRRYSGGLNGEGVEVRLIKVGEEWFVVDLVTQYVS